MNVAIGMRIRDGSWGGGNQFGATVSAYLRRQGHRVDGTLERADVDLILLTEPRRASGSSTFNDIDILRYLLHVNPRAVVIHRVNECDRGRNTKLRDPRLAVANRCANHTVFISQWLQTHFQSRGYRFADGSVIRNGADREIFHSDGGAVWQPGERLRIVTHHWSNNWMKGFDLYARLDRMLGQAPYRDLFEFTCIGRLPPGLTLPNTRCQPPAFGADLAVQLRRNHVYLTAARNEGAGMHHIEGAMCGLPLLYLESGALPEYCAGFGLPFQEATFEERLRQMPDAYGTLKARMPDYPFDADTMCRQYAELFTRLFDRREAIVRGRTRSPAGTRALMARARFLDAVAYLNLRAQAFLGSGRS